jgi:probable HAF family extracellular repeat protein
MRKISQDFSESAYSVADWRSTQFASTHELGHNMGAGHAPNDDDDPRRAFAYAYGHKVPGVFRTMMAYDSDVNFQFCRCPRIPNFSNPNVQLGGLPTGTVLGNNNAVTIENAAYTVANFRPSIPRYRVTFIRTNPEESMATSINAHGDVAGFTGVPYGAGAFYTRGRSVLPIVGGFTGAVLLNDHGHLALTERRAADGSVWPFVWDGVTRREIGSLGGTLTVAGDFNNHGTVVGLSYGPPGTPYRAFVWNGITIRDLNFGPSSSFSSAGGINDEGQICGTYVIPYSGPPDVGYSVFWDGTSVRELGTGQGGVAGQPYNCADLNNLGHSAGNVAAPHPSATISRPYIWDGSSFKSLGGFGLGHGSAWAINDRDEVVGSSVVDANENHAFLWRAGLLHDLHRLADWPEPGWILYVGNDINNVGQIAATVSKTSRGPFRAVRLDPPTLGQQLPLPPTDLTSQVDGRTVRLSWNAAPGGPYTYRIEAGSVDGWADLASVSVSNTSVSFSNVPDGRFFVRVRSQIGLTLSYPAPGLEVQVGQMAPQAPRDLKSTVTGTSVSFEWSSPLSGDPPSSYGLEAGTAPGATSVPIPIASSPYIVVGVPTGTYYVRVRGVNSAGTGPPSNEVKVIVGATSLPGAPTGLTFVQTGNQVTLMWTAPTTGGAVTGYHLEAGSVTTLADLAVVPVATTSLTAAAPAGTYYVRVRGINELGIGPASNEVVIVIP